MIQEALTEGTADIKVNRRRINSLRFAGVLSSVEVEKRDLYPLHQKNSGPTRPIGHALFKANPQPAQLGELAQNSYGAGGSSPVLLIIHYCRLLVADV